MNNKQIIISVLLILLCCTIRNYAQQGHLAEAMERIAKTNEIIKEKDYKWKATLTSMSLLFKEEFKKRCGIIADTTFNSLEQKQYGEKLYQEWKKIKSNGLCKIATSINWQGWMSDIEDQGDCGNCWAHSATGVTEGLLHYSYGQNINIDLDEMEITNNAICADGCDGCDYDHVECGLSYIKDYEVSSENHGQFPNRTNAYYSNASYSKQNESINAIQTALASSPVWATMSVYEDFQDYSSGIYEYTYGEYVCDHAIVIVDYGNEDGTDYWRCKNSWGSDWGEDGYFKIKFGECRIDSYGDFVTATVNSTSFASFVPQFFSSINDALQIAKSNEYVYVASGTYTETISMKSDVDLIGENMVNTIIDGTIAFSNDDYAGIEKLTVKDKITIYNSDNVTLDHIKSGHSDCYIESISSELELNDLYFDQSQSKAFYGHDCGYSDFYSGSFRYKNNQALYIHFFDTADLTDPYFCNNNFDIYVTPFSYVWVYGENSYFSSPTEGSTVTSGLVEWEDWYGCGGLAKSLAQSGADDPVIVVSSQDDSLDKRDYQQAMNKYRSIKYRLKEDRSAGKAVEPKKYESDYHEVIGDFKQVVANYPASL
jgi:C1A family cysteine protease